MSLSSAIPHKNYLMISTAPLKTKIDIEKHNFILSHLFKFKLNFLFCWDAIKKIYNIFYQPTTFCIITFQQFLQTFLKMKYHWWTQVLFCLSNNHPSIVSKVTILNVVAYDSFLYVLNIKVNEDIFIIVIYYHSYK